MLTVSTIFLDPAVISDSHVAGGERLISALITTQHRLIKLPRDCTTSLLLFYENNSLIRNYEIQTSRLPIGLSQCQIVNNYWKLRTEPKQNSHVPYIIMHYAMFALFHAGVAQNHCVRSPMRCVAKCLYTLHNNNSKYSNFVVQPTMIQQS